MTSPLGWWLQQMGHGLDRLLSGRKIDGARAAVGDPARFDVYGTDVCAEPDCQCGGQCYDQDDPCLDPGAHSLTGCPRCVTAIVACCTFDFDRSLASLLDGPR